MQNIVGAVSANIYLTLSSYNTFRGFWKYSEYHCNYVKFETGRNFPPVLKIVTHNGHAA